LREWDGKRLLQQMAPSSSAADEGDDFDAVAVGELPLSVLTLGNQRSVDFDRTGSLAQAALLQQLRHTAGRIKREGFIVDIDGQRHA